MDAKTALVKKEGRMKEMMGAIAEATPRHVQPDRVARVGLTALRTVKNLAICTEHSFFGAFLQSIQLGLEVNTNLGHAWLLPFKNNKTGFYEVQLIVGYKGMLDLAYRSGKLAGAWSYAVHECDDFHVEYGLTPNIRHIPDFNEDREKSPITHVYAVGAIKGGMPVFRHLTAAQVYKYRDRSPAARYKSGPWFTDEEAMFMKTAFRRLAPFLPQSAELATAVAIDEAPEIGKKQSTLYDETVKDILLDEGLEDDVPFDSDMNEPTDVTSEDVPEADKTTGEIPLGKEPDDKKS